MDIDVSRWILEFVLRECVEDRVVNALVRVLPLSNQPSSLKKTMLLRRIESEIANGSVSIKVLDLLEHIEELNHHEQVVAASELMKSAYCAVAVDCTVRCLDEREDKEAKYFEAVKRIWRGRILKMERSEQSVLVSDELWNWKDDIEAAVWDKGVWGNLRMKNMENDAVKVVRNYVVDEWKSMGPPFLKLVTETVSYESLKEVMELGAVQIRGQVSERVEGVPGAVHGLVAGNGDKEILKGNTLPRRKHVANKRSRGTFSGISRGIRIIDTEDVGIGTSRNQYECPPTVEVNKVREALKASTLELQAVVKDPLPEALKFAETVASDMGRENNSHVPSIEGQNRVDVDAVKHSVDNSAEAVQANENGLGNHPQNDQNKVPKPSIMDRNPSARTYEWDDSVAGLPGGSPSLSSRLQLPSPKGSLVSPLKKYEIAKLARRRKIKKWSQLEEDTLRTGVQKYGKGNWKLILNSYRDIFEERTEVDLKDKWRNMIR